MLSKRICFEEVVRISINKCLLVMKIYKVATFITTEMKLYKIETLSKHKKISIELLLKLLKNDLYYK